MTMSIAAKHAKGKSAQDKIFGANAAAVAAAAKYGKDAVTNATIGAIWTRMKSSSACRL